MRHCSQVPHMLHRPRLLPRYRPITCICHYDRKSVLTRSPSDSFPTSSSHTTLTRPRVRPPTTGASHRAPLHSPRPPPATKAVHRNGRPVRPLRYAFEQSLVWLREKWRAAPRSTKRWVPARCSKTVIRAGPSFPATLSLYLPSSARSPHLTPTVSTVARVDKVGNRGIAPGGEVSRRIAFLRTLQPFVLPVGPTPLLLPHSHT